MCIRDRPVAQQAAPLSGADHGPGQTLAQRAASAVHAASLPWSRSSAALALVQPSLEHSVRLGAAGIVETTRGMRGGVQLARPATDISLLDVIGAMEGGVTLNPCVATPHTCPLSDSCPAQRAWTDATRVLEDHLASVRFSALAGAAEVSNAAAASRVAALLSVFFATSSNWRASS